jgi:hypothetical protein
MSFPEHVVLLRSEALLVANRRELRFTASSYFKTHTSSSRNPRIWNVFPRCHQASKIRINHSRYMRLHCNNIALSNLVPRIYNIARDFDIFAARADMARQYPVVAQTDVLRCWRSDFFFDQNESHVIDRNLHLSQYSRAFIKSRRSTGLGI